MKLQLRDAIRRFVPPWLSDRPTSGRTVAWRLLWCTGLVLDAMVEGAQQGTIARMPGLGTPTALPYVGRDRGIVRGFAESAEAYGARLRIWRRAHRLKGHAFAILAQLTGYLAPFAVRARIVTNTGVWYTRETDGTLSWTSPSANWNWDNDSERWSRFWVILYPAAELWGPAPSYAGSRAWGAPNATFGTTATPEQIEQVRAIVQEWKPPSTLCEHIIVAFDPASFDPTGAPGAGLPGGDWGRWSKDVGGVRVASRLDTARYWRGTA